MQPPPHPIPSKPKTPQVLCNKFGFFPPAGVFFILFDSRCGHNHATFSFSSPSIFKTPATVISYSRHHFSFFFFLPCFSQNFGEPRPFTRGLPVISAHAGPLSLSLCVFVVTGIELQSRKIRKILVCMSEFFFLLFCFSL